MSRSIYILGIFIAAALGWASLIVVINNISPFISGYLALTMFYSSLFIALTGTFSILNYYLRISINKDKNYFRHLNIALRQGSLLSMMICVGLGFQRLRVLTWWDALLLLIIVLLIEYYFMARD
jgi:5-methylcytosine-specific restriction endonuclease McrBC GTP-binding regulatory subunit McrB